MLYPLPQPVMFVNGLEIPGSTSHDKHYFKPFDKTIPPIQIFKEHASYSNDVYNKKRHSKFDKNGIPTHDIIGNAYEQSRMRAFKQQQSTYTTKFNAAKLVATEASKSSSSSSSAHYSKAKITNPSRLWCSYDFAPGLAIPNNFTKNYVREEVANSRRAASARLAIMNIELLTCLAVVFHQLAFGLGVWTCK